MKNCKNAGHGSIRKLGIVFFEVREHSNFLRNCSWQKQTWNIFPIVSIHMSKLSWYSRLSVDFSQIQYSAILPNYYACFKLPLPFSFYLFPKNLYCPHLSITFPTSFISFLPPHFIWKRKISNGLCCFSFFFRHIMTIYKSLQDNSFRPRCNILSAFLDFQAYHHRAYWSECFSFLKICAKRLQLTKYKIFSVRNFFADIF